MPDKEKNSWSIWKCLECEGRPEFEHADMMKHMQEIHKIDTKTAKGTQKMIMHLDGRDWYQTDYEVTVNGLKFTHSVRLEREANDPMRF